MPYLYLIGTVLFMSSYSIFVSIYNRTNSGKKDISGLYSLICLTSIFLFWLVLFLINGTYDIAVLPYSILFAICFGVCNVADVIAYKVGSIVLTSLIIQLSLIGVSCWGFIFWGSKITYLVIIGLVLVAIALWLCLYKGKEEEKKKINFTWIICVTLAFVGNAGCTIVQRTQQMVFDGQYAEFLMVVATALAVLIGLVNYLRSDRSDSVVIIKKTGYLPVLAAVLNGLVNLFVILMVSTPISKTNPNPLSPTLIYPVLAVGSLAVTTVFSKFVFKEQMRWWQWLGVLIGAVAVGILSI